MLALLFTFLFSIIANVVSYYICKWLNRKIGR